MAPEMIARCGFKCHDCAAFIANNRTHADQVRAAEGWATYFGLVAPPEQIRCNGCMSADRGGYESPEKNCPIAPCAKGKGFRNCAECGEYPRDKLEARMRVCDEVIERHRVKAPRKEYDRFIAPYDARTTLNAIRKAKE